MEIGATHLLGHPCCMYIRIIPKNFVLQKIVYLHFFLMLHAQIITVRLSIVSCWSYGIALRIWVLKSPGNANHTKTTTPHKPKIS